LSSPKKRFLKRKSLRNFQTSPTTNFLAKGINIRPKKNVGRKRNNWAKELGKNPNLKGNITTNVSPRKVFWEELLEN